MATLRSEYKYGSSLFIGATTHGRPMPVFFDPHTPIINNKPPGCLITGAPGSGKTFFALTLTAMSAILGKTTVVLDPKGDFLALDNIKDSIGRFAIWNLSEGKAGLLDPFYMVSDPSDKLTLVLQVIDLFVGGLNDDQTTVLAPIVKDVIVSDNPSLQKVVDYLRGSEKDIARNLGTQLDLIRKMRFAKLCFAPGNAKRPEVSISKGLTVVTLVGLDLPKGRPENRQENLAAGILFLLTDFLSRIMMNEAGKNPKTLVIDEAHAIIESEAGARSVKNIALLGRSKFLALILITQNNSHLERLDIENTISTRFAFRSSRNEAEDIIAAMELPNGEGFEEAIINLNNGECLMKDFMNRYSTVQISAWRTDWKEAFNSNPLDKIRKRAEEAQNARAAKA